MLAFVAGREPCPRRGTVIPGLNPPECRPLVYRRLNEWNHDAVRKLLPGYKELN